MVYLIGFSIVVVIGAIIFFRSRGSKTVEANPKVGATYESENGSFAADGTMNEFVIRKDDRFEFLVRGGVIVACKDKRRHRDFVYYEET